MSGTVVSVNLSARKGTPKRPIGAGRITRRGLARDAHAGPWHRQVSLLAQEQIDALGADSGEEFRPGDFAENITTRGVNLGEVAVRDRIEVGSALLEVTQIGKECHARCAIYHQAGDCVMPREGIFVRVLVGGRVAPGDVVRVRAWGLGPSGVGASVIGTAADPTKPGFKGAF